MGLRRSLERVQIIAFNNANEFLLEGEHWGGELYGRDGIFERIPKHYTKFYLTTILDLARKYS